MPNLLWLSGGDLDALLASGVLTHHEPVIRAVRTSGSLFVALFAGATIPSERAASGRPWIVIVGDDLLTGSAGPAAFDQPALRRYAGHAVYIAIYSAGVDPSVYAAFAASLCLGARLLIVETTLRHAVPWADWARRWAPKVSIVEIQPAPVGNA